MAQNMSEKIVRVQDCTPAINYDYTELVYFSVVVTGVTVLYYVYFYRYPFQNFPCCSLEFFIIYARLTGRYIGELPASTGKILLF